MPLPAQYASLDGLVDLLVEAMLREIQTPVTETVAQPPTVRRSQFIDGEQGQ